MFEIKVPQLGVNDQSAKVVEWLISDRGIVEQGQTICVLETTKVAFDLVAEKSGFLFQVVEVSEEVKIGQIIGLLGDNLDQLLARQNQIFGEIF